MARANYAFDIRVGITFGMPAGTGSGRKVDRYGTASTGKIDEVFASAAINLVGTTTACEVVVRGIGQNLIAL